MDRRSVLGAALAGPSWLAACATPPATGQPRLGDTAAWRKLDVNDSEGDCAACAIGTELWKYTPRTAGA
jgi:hypothetical protein